MLWKAPMPLAAAVSGPPQLWEPIADDEISNAATHEIAWTKDYRAVRVSIYALVPVTNNAFLRMRTSGDGGATFDAGASDYRFEVYQARNVQAFSQNVTDNYIALMAGSDGLSLAAELGMNAEVVVTQPFDNKQTVVHGRTNYWPNSGVLSSGLLYGLRLAAGRVDALQLLLNTGNINTGRVRAIGVLPYGEA